MDLRPKIPFGPPCIRHKTNGIPHDESKYFSAVNARFYNSKNKLRNELIQMAPTQQFQNLFFHTSETELYKFNK